MIATTTTDRQTIEVDGCTVSYARGGAGEPLLFLHGAGGVRGDEPVFDRLAERYDLILPDHPGFGRSDTPPWLDTIHDLGYFYLDFIDALGLRDVHLAGHSLGGWIAAEAAVRSASRLRGLTLVASAGLRVKGVEMADVFLLPPDELDALARTRSEPPANDDEFDVQLKNRDTFALLAWNPRLYDPHLAKWLHRIRIPTSLVWGECDGIIPPAYADEFRRLIPHARVHLFPECGHRPHVERPEAFLETIA
jgi:pimeloyl-ACP methyl ester carboxylesterase